MNEGLVAMNDPLFKYTDDEMGAYNYRDESALIIVEHQPADFSECCCYTSIFSVFT